jgi:hypothetical protein
MTARKHNSSTAARMSMPVALGGVGAVGFLALLWLLLSQFGAKPKALEDQVAMLRARAGSLRYAEPEKSLEDFRTVANHEGFSKLSKGNQGFINESLRALEAYHEYERAVAAVPEPKAASSMEQLEKIKSSLTGLAVPHEYRVDWKGTKAYERHAEWLEDVQALRLAIKDTQRAFEDIIRDGKKVIDTADQANLPGRTKDVFARAKELPDPVRDRDKSIPNSERITYATVFHIQPLPDLHRQWQEIENRLKPLLSTVQP